MPDNEVYFLKKFLFKVKCLNIFIINFNKIFWFQNLIIFIWYLIHFDNNILFWFHKLDQTINIENFNCDFFKNIFLKL